MTESFMIFDPDCNINSSSILIHLPKASGLKLSKNAAIRHAARRPA